MSPILSTLLFAATATAQLTTSIFLATEYTNDAEDVRYKGSVIGVKNDKTTYAVEYDLDAMPRSLSVMYSGLDTQTITIEGTTHFESMTTYAGREMTYSMGCDMPSSARALCTMSVGGPDAFDVFCDGQSTYTGATTSFYEYEYTYTSDSGEEYTSTETLTETYDEAEYWPDFCTEGGSTVPEEYAVTTTRIQGTAVPLVITAGEAKLTATPAASLSSSARSTGSGSQSAATGTPRSTGSDVEVSQTGPTNAPAAPAETGAAAPMITMAPALAGLGLAMAALVF